jgi:hypothetical protein
VTTSLIEGKHLSGWKMLPARAGTCQDCAVEHRPEQPHNAQSLFYQYRFYNDHGRWPNWMDAMSHCSEETKLHWVSEIKKLGVDVFSGQVNP